MGGVSFFISAAAAAVSRERGLSLAGLTCYVPGMGSLVIPTGMGGRRRSLNHSLFSAMYDAYGSGY